LCVHFYPDAVVERRINNSLNFSPSIRENFLLNQVQINTGEYTKHINGQTYRGLPDSHDFSKQKDFFAIFPALYCSGWKRDGNYHADYCSPWGRQLFDLHRLWRVWGVDLVENKLVAQTPKMIFIGLITSAASAGLSLLVGLLAVYSYRCTLLVTVLSWVSKRHLVLKTLKQQKMGLPCLHRSL
jgi:hypothetical protein